MKKVNKNQESSGHSQQCLVTGKSATPILESHVNTITTYRSTDPGDQNSMGTHSGVGKPELLLTDCKIRMETSEFKSSEKTHP